ncbi:endonuclease subunit [uncultured Caudovirales phage]|uniref:Endonuclease subunit n=1 Tax=uncultured Caudovirales phage TaxID=2100421 RepID=A0A6J5KWJ8_9CAUD|nr:endonuclease subunit [uncultured Caudovirales phage]
MIQFRTVKWKNFLSTGNIFTEINLSESPSTLIVGTNGAGKSTMLDALTFALFGKPFRNINKPTLINSINEKDCLVEVEFRTMNTNYKIVRGIKPNKFEIYADGELLNQDAASKDYQEVLEDQILKFKYKAFTQIVILGSSSFVPFMQLSANDRRSIIEDLLDINIFSAMNVVVKEKATAIKAQVSTFKTQIETTLSKIDMQKKYIEDAQKNNKELVESKEKEYDEHNSQIESLRVDVKLIQKHIDVLLKGVASESTSKDKQKKLGQIEAKIENNISKNKKDIEFYTKNSNCPTCDQVINNKDEKLSQCKHKIAELTGGLEQLHIQYNEVSEKLIEIAAVHKKINSHNSEITRINASIVQIQKYTKKLLAEIDALKNKKVLSDDMMGVSRELVDKLEELNGSRKDLIENKNYIDVAAILLKDSGIKAKIVKQYLPIINKLVNKYLASMDFFVNFEIDEEFKEIIKSRHRDIFSYENFSEGEKMRIDLALLFTWRAIAKMKSSMSTNLLILDEVFDSSLDNNGTEEFMKLIHSLNDANVFVISHKGDVLMDKFRNVIRFDKVKNFSRIV